MTRLLKKKKRAVRRLDLTPFREALADGKTWCEVGMVYQPTDAGSHFEIDEDVGVLVHVQLMPYKTPLMCRLGGLGEGGLRGVWKVPPVGSEVAVILPGGTVESDTLIVAVLSSGGVPPELDEETLVVRGTKVVIICDDAETVEIRSASGTALPLATKADVQAVVTYVKKQFSTASGHVHATPSGPSTTITEGTTGAAGSTLADPAGTVVLKAE